MKENNNYAISAVISAGLGWFFASILFAPLAVYFGVKGTKAEQGYNILAWIGLAVGIFELSLIFVYILSIVAIS